jgi:hypothetical protein
MAPAKDGALAAAAAAPVARRRVGDALRLPALRLVLRLAAPFRAALFRAALFRAALFRALVLREAPARERVERFALRAAVDFRPRAALFLRLPLLFFLPRGGILLLRELPRNERRATQYVPA